MFSFGNGVINWSSKKQPTIALSGTEYKGATIATCEVVWLQKTIFRFGILSGCSCCHLL
jgi:hypothetical protein